jgi:hypothetical protein
MKGRSGSLLILCCCSDKIFKEAYSCVPSESLLIVAESVGMKRSQIRSTREVMKIIDKYGA